MLGIILKLLIPAAILYFILWTMKNALVPPDTESEKFDAKNSSKKKPDDDVIDVCPECGEVVKSGHTCKN